MLKIFILTLFTVVSGFMLSSPEYFVVINGWFNLSIIKPYWCIFWSFMFTLCTIFGKGVFDLHLDRVKKKYDAIQKENNLWKKAEKQLKVNVF